jgi:FkbM family methyltransferase
MLISNFINFIASKEDFNPSIIFDIGSRDLDQSIEVSRVYPNAKIYAFEPNPDQYVICKQKAADYSNIEVHQLALSDQKGSVDFYKTLGNIGASSLLEPIDVPFASSQIVEKIKVDTDTLQNWMTDMQIQRADILWMDVQGVELAALKGMGNYLKTVKYLHCEASISAYYKNHILKDELETFLHSQGFHTEFHPVYHPYGEGDIFAVNSNL